MNLRINNNRSKVLDRESRLCQGILIFLALICIIPVWMAVAASFTGEKTLVNEGYSLLPKDFTFDTYVYMFSNKAKFMLDSLKMSLLSTALGTITTLVVTSCFAWAVTQKREDFYFARPLSFVAWFTTIFGGGILPWYILCTQYYGLKNNIFALFIPSCFSVWNMYILRGSFRSVPLEIIESAKIDGASNSRIFLQIVIPLARSGITTVAMFSMLSFWNDFSLPLWLTTKQQFATLQLLLYNMLSTTSFLLQNSSLSGLTAHMVVPTETSVMAVAVIAIVPILLIYPFTLRYFVKGINLGGVKA